MAVIKFTNGQSVRFHGNPTPQDVEEVARKLGISSGATPPPAQDNRDFFQKTTDAIKATPILNATVPLGEAVGRSGAALVESFKQGSLKPLMEAGQENNENFGKIVGSTAASAAFPASLALSAPASLPGAIGQYAGLGAVQAGGEALARGEGTLDAAGDAAMGGAIGGAAGGVFNLLGRAVSAAARTAGPSALEFTSGVPRAAIKQTLANPQAAKEGLKLPVSEVREKAVTSLQSLYQDLGREFDDGLKSVISTTGQTKKGVTFNQQGFIKSASAMRDRLSEYSREFAREFRLGTKATPDGIVINFDKSPITKPGEQRAVQEAFKSISTWNDFSAKGLQDLAERIGSLRNFESGAKTESSAIVSKIYNKITGAGGQADHGLISKFYPELASIRTNYAKNRKVLDEISNVLSADKSKPVSVQASVTRLDNLFRDNRDEYINVVRELSNRSGVDFLSLLAGGEFQKVLPSFIRGLGGAGVVGVGAAVLNPWLLLLAPLFSPRAVGALTRNAPGAAKTASQLVRAGTAQAIQQGVPKGVRQEEDTQ